MRLRRMAVGGLQRHEPAGQAVMLEAERKAPVRFAGCNAEQPAVRFQLVEQREDAVEQRLFDPAFLRSKNLPVPPWLDRKASIDPGLV